MPWPFATIPPSKARYCSRLKRPMARAGGSPIRCDGNVRAVALECSGRSEGCIGLPFKVASHAL